MPSSKANTLLISSGSKVAIARIAQSATKARGAVLHACDTSRRVPTQSAVERFTQIEQDAPEDWAEALVAYCQENSIGLAIPTRHGDLPALDAYRDKFAEAGITLALSSSSALDICMDKLMTHAFFQEHGIPAPATASLSAWDHSSKASLIAKPATGSGGQFKEIQSPQDLDNIPSNWLVQEKAKGDEFTISVYVSRTGKAICAIPRRRLATQEGEVMQARTENVAPLIDCARRIGESLPEAWGPINLQAFYDEASGDCQFIEINPRLGGGFPLAHQAGGTFIEWLHQETHGEKALPENPQWTPNLLMMRYREAVFSID